MTADLQLIFTLISFLVAAAFQTWGIIRYLLDRTDKKIEDERRERTDQIEKIKMEMKLFVQKEDFHRYVDDVKVTIHSMGTEMNRRLDSILSTITQLAMKGNTKHDE